MIPGAYLYFCFFFFNYYHSVLGANFYFNKYKTNKKNKKWLECVLKVLARSRLIVFIRLMQGLTMAKINFPWCFLICHGGASLYQWSVQWNSLQFDVNWLFSFSLLLYFCASPSRISQQPFNFFFFRFDPYSFN